MTSVNQAVDVPGAASAAATDILPGRSAVRHDRYVVSADERAARFYLERLFVPYRRRSRLIGALAGLNSSAALKILGRLDAPPAPVSGRGAFQDRRGQLQDAVRDVMRRRDIDPDPTTTIVLSSPQSDGAGRDMIFLISKQTGELAALIRISADGHQQEILRRTYRRLTELRGRLPERWRAVLPKPLALCEVAPYTAYVESGLPGRSLYVASLRDTDCRRQAARHFEMAGRFVSGFHRATAGTVVPLSQEHIDRYVRLPASTYCDRTGASPQVREFVERLEERAVGLVGADIPLVTIHGDFWARNLLQRNGSLYAIDWEHMQLQAPPFADWFMFCLSYGHMFERRSSAADRQSALHHVLNGAGLVSSHARRFVAGCCAELGVEAPLLPVFLGIFLLDRAAGESGHGTGRWRAALDEFARLPWSDTLWPEPGP